MSKTIIVIDDDPKVLELVTAILKPDYTIKSFSDPKEAVKALNEGVKPDLIICDIMMPEMTGFEVHEAVRSMSALISVPFLYLTALDERESFRKGMLLGADDYITKPFLAKELRESVKIRFDRAVEIQQDVDQVLSIQSLGGLKVIYGQERINWNVKKAAAAFLYLLYHQESISLEKMKQDLWWEAVVDNTLHVLNLRLRKVITPFAKLEVRHGRATLEMLCPYTWDAREFDAKAKEALESLSFRKIEDALQIYKGNFLPNFDLPWTEEIRSQYDNIHFELLKLSPEVAPDATNKRVARERLERFIDG